MTTFDKLKPHYGEDAILNGLHLKLEQYKYVADLPLSLCMKLVGACNKSLLNIYDLFE